MLKGRLSTEWFCLAHELYDERITKLRGHTIKSLQRLIKRKELVPEVHWVKTICGSSERKFVPLEVYDPDPNGRIVRPLIVLADVVTGSLYNPDTGECYTGNLKIKEL